MTHDTITFLGNFGTQNLGNEYTLAAIVRSARERRPQARLACVCPNPEDVSTRHGVQGFLISYRYSKEFTRRAWHRASTRLVRILRRLFVRGPREIWGLARAYRSLAGTRMLVMTGTGMLGDFGIEPLGLHYEILKWAALAKAHGAKVLFVSVGAGPLAKPLSRRIVKWALSIADYRSYRDEFSRRYLAEIGFDTKKDFVYPDIAFGLPVDAALPRLRRTRVVGLGVMDYYGTESDPRRGEETYRQYLENLANFVSWLLERDYTVHLLIGDVTYDRSGKQDLLKLLERRPSPTKGRIVDIPISSNEDLLRAISETGFVVSARFHNLVLAVMLGRPILALAYHPKIVELMCGLGLSEYCHDIERWDAARLTRQFLGLEQNAALIASRVEQRAAEWREALAEQYDRIFPWEGSDAALDRSPQRRAVVRRT
ncbi:MAG TPA: polysaccharide pyruvyl transferase family protein [Anaeromyxobacter sp.]|nr:polysaccharide pyruvyl transferase family protein [Anaeromyxobacter sp.]